MASLHDEYGKEQLSSQFVLIVQNDIRGKQVASTTPVGTVAEHSLMEVELSTFLQVLSEYVTKEHDDESVFTIAP